MEKRALGQSGITVSALGLGCMGMSEFYGAHDDAQSLDTLAHAVERGVTFFDTADMYGQGHNEQLLARFLPGRRDGLTIASKFGIVRDGTGYGRHIDNSPAYIAQACDASLARLGIETIDLYYAHRIDKTRPIEETVEAMARLITAGKVRAIGLCEVSPQTLRRAHAVHPIAAVQSEWSLWSRDPETDGTLATCRELGVSFVAYSPLGRGFLTGALNGTEGLDEKDFRRLSPRFLAENMARNQKLVDRIKELAAAKSVTPGQLVLAWLLGQGQDVIPIPGTRRIVHLDENLAAAEIRLSGNELAELSAAIPPGAAAGQRYPEEGMKGMSA